MHSPDIAPRSSAFSDQPASALDNRQQAELPAERNRLLHALPPEDYAWLQPHLERVRLPTRHVLAEQNAPLAHAYFPETGIISLVNRLVDGSTVEVGTIGNEGMAGLGIILDANAVPSVTKVQVAGEFARLPADVMARAAEERPAVRRALNRYTQAFLTQVAQTAACNRAHDIEERCARWMCMTHDRVGGADTFELTHEVLAQMLGVRRAGVTVAAGILQKAGFIRYSRGLVTVLDRSGLEAAACECYGIVRAHFDRLLGTPAG